METMKGNGNIRDVIEGGCGGRDEVEGPTAGLSGRCPDARCCPPRTALVLVYIALKLWTTERSFVCSIALFCAVWIGTTKLTYVGLYGACHQGQRGSHAMMAIPSVQREARSRTAFCRPATTSSLNGVRRQEPEVTQGQATSTRDTAFHSSYAKGTNIFNPFWYNDTS